MNRTTAVIMWLPVTLLPGACHDAGRTTTTTPEVQAGTPTASEPDLPPETFADGWIRQEPPKFFVGTNLFSRINGAAELFLELGFVQLTVQRYHHGEAFVELEIYDMDSAAAALGIYWHKRGREVRLEGLAGQHTGNRFQISARKGSRFIQVNNFAGDGALLPAMVQLTGTVLERVAADEPHELLAMLPEEGRRPGSELIIRGPFSVQRLVTLGAGDVLQLHGKIFGIAADFESAAGGTFTLIVIPYGQATTAAAAFDNLVTHLDDQLTVIHKETNNLVFRDHKDRCGVVKQDQERLQIRLHLSCDQAH